MNENGLKTRSIPQITSPDRRVLAQTDVKRQWVEARVRALYASVANESVPEELTDLVIRLGRAN